MTHTAEVVDVYEVTPRVKGFRLRVPGHEFEFEPGQHTTVRFEAVDDLRGADIEQFGDGTEHGIDTAKIVSDGFELSLVS